MSWTLSGRWKESEEYLQIDKKTNYAVVDRVAQKISSPVGYVNMKMFRWTMDTSSTVVPRISEFVLLIVNQLVKVFVLVLMIILLFLKVKSLLLFVLKIMKVIPIVDVKVESYKKYKLNTVFLNYLSMFNILNNALILS